jgi:hypothetical protein
MIQAPFVTSLRIDKLSANQVSIRWDEVGANFYYFVEITETHNIDGGENSDTIDYSAIVDTKYYGDIDLTAGTHT